MKPLDPRLLKHARAARGYIVLTALLGLAQAVLIAIQAYCIAYMVGPVAFSGVPFASVSHLLPPLAVVVVLRAAVSWLQERYAHRSATRTIAQLRRQVLQRAIELGPRWLSTGRAADIATLVTRGLDSLDAYFVRYLPQLLLTAIVTPLLVVIVWSQDWLSAVITICTLPLIPLFMILIGKLTSEFSDRKLAAMTRLGSQLLDLIAGLPTLKALGRERGPIKRIRQLGDAHAKATMATLRVAFLSGMVLELLATLSVAVVAVEIGMRLVYGRMDLTTGLFVLILAPEIYLPLRQVGAHFHASADGVAAATKAFEIIETPGPGGTPSPGRVQAADDEAADDGTRAGVRVPDLAGASFELAGVSVQPPERHRLAPHRLSCVARPGRVLALTGPNGQGKSTAASVLLGLVTPAEGRVLIHPADGAPVELTELDPEALWPSMTWVPQRPVLLPGTVLENVTAWGSADDDEPAAGAGSRAEAGSHVTAEPRAAEQPPAERATPIASATASSPGLEPDQAVLDAARSTGLDAVVEQLPGGWNTAIGHGGVGLSVGQRQRVALTRALLDVRPLVILDEPTAHLDAAGERVVLDCVKRLAAAGSAVVLIAHRASLLRAADDVVTVEALDLPPEDESPELAGQEVSA